MIQLQTQTRFTVAEMAAEMGVSRRTMLRDLQALSEMGVPLAASPGRYGGYQLIRSRRLLPLSLSPDEAIGMVLSYESFLQYAESPFAEGSLSAITKLRQALPPDIVREIDRIREHVVVVEVTRSMPAPLLGAVLQASLDRVYLDVAYDSRSGMTERRIFPYGLYASQGLWYCVCLDSRREGTILLRVDRIRSAERVEEMEAPEELTVREWLRTSRTDAPNMLPFRARLTRRGARNLEIETLFGEITPGEDGESVVESEMPLSELEWFAARFMMLGTDIRVESPPELIEIMRRMAEGIVGLYSQYHP